MKKHLWMLTVISCFSVGLEGQFGKVLAEGLRGEPMSKPVSTTPVTHTEVCKVDLIAQKKSLLCWAASMQMITKYQGQEKDQCQLIGSYYDLRSTRMGVSSPAISSTVNAFTATCESTPCLASTFTQFMVTPIPLDWNMDLNPSSDFKPLFLKAGFKSRATNSSLAWLTITAQIGQCQPFISLLCEGCPSGAENESPKHAVVTTGYWNNTKNKWLTVNDPWGLVPCQGYAYYLKYQPSRKASMNSQVSGTPISIVTTSTILDIEPKLTNDSLCTPDRKLSARAASSILPRPSTITHFSVSDSAMYLMKSHYFIKVHYLSVDKLNQLVPLHLESFKTEYQVVDMICTTHERPIVYTLFPTSAKRWEVVKIAYSQYPVVLTCSLKNTTVSLSFKPSKPGTIPYEQVIVPALQQRYYRFVWKGLPFLVPSTTYQFGTNDLLVPEKAYSEYTVLSKMRGLVRNRHAHN